MSNTRHAAPGSELRQGKFASSPEFGEGLLANLVTKRSRATSNIEERRLIQCLQWLSHQEGGLSKVALDLIQRNPNRLATRGMMNIRTTGGHYNSEQSLAVRGELPFDVQEGFPLRGHPMDLELITEGPYDSGNSTNHPDSYSVTAFQKACKTAAVECLAGHLQEVCLNPSASLMDDARPWYFRGLGAAVKDYLDHLTSVARGRFVETQLTRELFDTLDYGLETRCMVVVEGLARTGKTFAAAAWCDMHPGRARYVQVPSTGDDIGFFRAVSEGIGSSAGSCLKATQMREKIEDALRGGELMVVFDESHYLLPQRNLRYAIPNRLNWVMTALVNRGIPVALVTTPQFGKSQRTIEQKTGWASEQFIGRIGHWQRLPDRLAEKELEDIARHLLPKGDGKSIEALVAYAQASSKYLAGIESAARHAKYRADKAGRNRVEFADVKEAIQGGVIPSDTALAKAFGSGRETERNPGLPPFVPIQREQQTGSGHVKAMQRRSQSIETLLPDHVVPRSEAHDLVMA